MAKRHRAFQIRHFPVKGRGIVMKKNTMLVAILVTLSFFFTSLAVASPLKDWQEIEVKQKILKMRLYGEILEMKGVEVLALSSGINISGSLRIFTYFVRVPCQLRLVNGAVGQVNMYFAVDKGLYLVDKHDPVFSQSQFVIKKGTEVIDGVSFLNGFGYQKKGAMTKKEKAFIHDSINTLLTSGEKTFGSSWKKEVYKDRLYR